MAFKVKWGSQSDLCADSYADDGRGHKGSRSHIQPDPRGDAGNKSSFFCLEDQGQDGRRRRQRRRRGRSRQRQYDRGDYSEEDDGSDTSEEIFTGYNQGQGGKVGNNPPQNQSKKDSDRSRWQKRGMSEGTGRGGGGNQLYQEDESDEDVGRSDGSRKVNDQDGAESPDTLPSVDPDEKMRVFKFLLNNYNGRTKLGTLMAKKGNLLQGFIYQQAASWMRRSTDFRVFEKQGQIKWISIGSKKARLCFNYRDHNTEKCHNEKCPFFHVCRDFVSGTCPFGLNCGFSHSFLNGSNAAVSAKLALQDFANEEIRIIVFRSTPVVCDKFNKGGCNEDCPDLHVCAQFIRKTCLDEDCKYGHKLKGTEHNDWVLSTFHLQKMFDNTLNKIVMTHRSDSAESCKLDPAGAGRKMETNCTAPGAKESLNQQKRTNSATAFQKDQNSTAGENSKQKPAQRNQKAQKPPTEKLLEPEKVATCAHGHTRDQISHAGGQSQPGEKQAVGTKLSAAEHEKGGRQQVRQNLPASHYEELCEKYTWAGTCQEGASCPRYHHPNRYPFVWQLHVYGAWQELSHADSLDIEEQFCALAARGSFEVILSSIGGLQIYLDFNTLAAVVNDGSDVSTAAVTKVRRWSVPSYVDGRADCALNLYTQWLWYQQSSGKHFVPYDSGSLQYTLEEKYLRGQQKYYFEHANGKRFLVLFKDKMIIDLQKGTTYSLLRRPFQPLVDRGASVPLLSSVLLSKPPTIHQTDLPVHWCTVDRYQNFELVELTTSSAEYVDVERSFRSTMRRSQATIVHIFRVQNPSLWDKFCSAKRSMAPPEGSVEEVEERQLFHGTPALLAARGICTNGFDFRRAGQNVGARFGRGSYFSTTARFSHSYTQSPDRFMFQARVLVGEYTKGDPSYTSPPPCEGLRLYGSCVNDEDNPTIFVIFDLAQGYPEYLIQYNDTEVASVGHAHAGPSRPAATTASASASYRTLPTSVGSAAGVAAASSHTTPAPTRPAVAVHLNTLPSGSSNSPASTLPRKTIHPRALPGSSYTNPGSSSPPSASSNTPTSSLPRKTIHLRALPGSSYPNPGSSSPQYRSTSGSTGYGGLGAYGMSGNGSGLSDNATPLPRLPSSRSLNEGTSRQYVEDASSSKSKDTSRRCVIS